tara:strand:- start:2162 stop:2887 length:726 start_codon:yes stop_codon:yes gene_type:complete
MATYADLFIDFWNYLITIIIPRFLEMVVVPVQRKEALEIIIPLIITLFLVQTYFGRHKEEKLGWNTAYGNCIVLLFVTANLINYIYNTYGLEGLQILGGVAFYKSLAAVGLGLIALCLLFIDFFHSIDRRISFFLSSSIFITVIAFVSIVLVYSEIPFDKTTLSTSIFILFVLVAFFELFRYIIPPSLEAERYLEKRRRIREEIRQSKIRRMKFRFGQAKTKTKSFLEHIKDLWEFILGRK